MYSTKYTTKEQSVQIPVQVLSSVGRILGVVRADMIICLS